MKLKELAEKLGLKFRGDPETEIERVASLESADKKCVSFFTNPRLLKKLLTTKAGAVIISEKDCPKDVDFAAIFSEDPAESFRQAMIILNPPKKTEPTISEFAIIADEAEIGKDVRIEPFVVIGKSKIGDRCVIHAGVVIGDGVEIGHDCEIYPNVVIYDGITIGNRVIIHAGAVIGSDGFGYTRNKNGRFNKIPQLGSVIIEDDVEIGANTTIDRATLDNTIIGAGTKIDNLVQIGHNVIIGKHCSISGQAGIAGSTKIGDRVMIGGQAGISDHIELGDDVTIYAQSGVDKSFPSGITLFGSPARRARETLKQLAALKKLPEIIDKLTKKQNKS
ncbi:UDP-3-O-(3-hydroxymyristoyl)glucosamine N-acyltransferase [bacterium]|nr:UDP-3-O-(3-hydroxymyristoyl)glucosamine N-acyltransferase [bacterium]